MDKHIALGMAAIAAGAIVLSWRGSAAAGQPVAMLAIALAWLGWAIDNNLTRKVALSDPVQIAGIKGALAGLVNVAVAFWAGAGMPSMANAGAAALVGLVGYGVSLVLFVRALREIGAARTGAYFSLAPFAGAILSVTLLGEKLTLQLVSAGLLISAGLWLHLTEHHEHDHLRPELDHDHAHVHDDHHGHEHDAPEPAAEPHAHRHRHGGLTHRHPHFPDVHHEHLH